MATSKVDFSPVFSPVKTRAQRAAKARDSRSAASQTVDDDADSPRTPSPDADLSEMISSLELTPMSATRGTMARSLPTVLDEQEISLASKF